MIPNPQPPQAPPMGAPPQVPPMQATSLPLPAEADFGFWKSEVERADRAQDPYKSDWQNNVEYYKAGKPTDKPTTADYVNVNVDFYQVEQKQAQLFYEQPDLQLTVKGALSVPPPMPLPGQPPQPANDQQSAAIIQAHRALMNELLGDEQMDVLATVQKAIKSCLCVEGTAPVLLGYQPTVRSVTPPVQPGSILGLQGAIDVPLYKQFYALNFSRRKFLHPVDFADTDWDRAPWLGMRFRMPFTVASREFKDVFGKYPQFTGTTTADQYLIEQSDRQNESAGLAYVDGVLIFYRAAQYDPAAIHPELYRELVLIDGLDEPARHRDSPHQTINPDGSLSGDSLIGNPIHPLTIRSVPDSSFVPSDSRMTRGLVQELCTFRKQMVQLRDTNRTYYLFDVDKLPPETVAKIENRTIGSLIGVEGGYLAQGANSIIAPVSPGSQGRETYLANDYITRDIEKTLAIDATGAGVQESDNETATKTNLVDRNRSVRLDAERRQVLRWYLKLVYKVSAMACRYLNQQDVTRYIGQAQAQAWAQWDKKAVDGRVAFKAKPDSQIRLDAAVERRNILQLYQMTANDPNVARVALLKSLFEKFGLNPSEIVVDQLPAKPHDENISLRLGGEDLVGPQRPIVLELLAQGGYQISQQAIDESAGQLFKQVTLGLRDANGKAVPATPRLAEHGGPAEQVRSLSKQQGDETGNRPGRPSFGGEAA